MSEAKYVFYSAYTYLNVTAIYFTTIQYQTKINVIFSY